jgi:hypothetical protein
MNPEHQPPLPKESKEGNSHTADFEGRLVDVYKLIHFAEVLPEETMPIAELEDTLNGYYWKDKNNDWLGPRQILEAIGNHTGTVNWEEIIQNYPAWEDEINKIKRADYQTHPILIIGKSDVIDGMHRLTKAKIDGTQQIKIKRFQSMPENVFIP